ncbi:MAG: tetratricopeptide repeat protein [Roseinatronobacter sp.]
MFSPSLLARAFTLIAALTIAAPATLQAQNAEHALPSGLAGAFLTGRVAVASDDFSRMALSYSRALQADPENEGFRELAMQASLLTGDLEAAARFAAQAAARDQVTQAAALILQADAFKRGEYALVIDMLDQGNLTGPLTDAMGRAWAKLGAGSMSEALEAFDAAIAERAEIAPFARYHKALALALVGDMERAADILSGDAEGRVSMSRRGILAHMTILSQIGKFDEALQLAESVFGSAADDDVAEIVASLQAEQPVPFTTVTSAIDGMAEVYFTLSGALVGEQGDWLPIIYGQLALSLRADHGDAILLTGQLLERLSQYDLADQTYRLMPEGHPQYLGAALGRTNALYQAGQAEEAIAALMALSETRPDSALVFSSLGDLLRREEQFAEAAEAYTRAIDLIDEIEERHWVLLYTRAIALERIGDWEAAEPEFRRVLEFVPDEPQVLNYLGYSLLEQRRNLDEALDMIERAVAGDPESGYITDSLGWAYYRLGRYEEAVPVMERAVELLPRDPILNDHLGDVYYAVGRTREARFQWRRALSFAPHPDLDVDLVRRKLEIGKDAALEEFESAQ